MEIANKNASKLRCVRLESMLEEGPVNKRAGKGRTEWSITIESAT
jgi:hypothetical protein